MFNDTVELRAQVLFKFCPNSELREANIFPLLVLVPVFNFSSLRKMLGTFFLGAKERPSYLVQILPVRSTLLLPNVFLCVEMFAFCFWTLIIKYLSLFLSFCLSTCSHILSDELCCLYHPQNQFLTIYFREPPLSYSQPILCGCL